MNKTMKYLSMAALALVGAVVTSCSSDDELLQPTNPGKVITLSTTVNLDNGSGTRALNPTTGAKTFAEGETMALRYMSTSGWKKAVSHALTISDITGGTSATFTFDLEDPVKTQPVSYVYPASMADEDGDIDFDLLSTQDGTLGTLESNFDLAYYAGAWVGGNLPSVTLQNQLAILAIKLKNESGINDITDEITGMTLNDGANTYTVTRDAAVGPIYVAIIPGTYPTITITATDGTKYYMKTLSNKTYATNNVYPVNWRMPEYVFNGKFSVGESKQVVFSPGNLQLVGENTWQFATNQWDYFGDTQADNHRDLFGWGTGDNPNKTSQDNNDYATFNDWGNNSFLQAQLGTGWYTLSNAEWHYLFKTRPSAAAKYGYATVNEKHGIIILPDVFTDPNKNKGSNAFVGSTTTGWAANEYTSEDWADMEAAGCVFLPAAGARYEKGVGNTDIGYYWSSTPNGNFSSNAAYSVCITSDLLYTENAPFYCREGQSVRLVRDAK